MPFRLTTPKPSKSDRLAESVFRRIDMQRGDPNVCWPWKGYIDRAPITRIGGRRWFVNRIVWGLTHGIPYDQVPKLTWLCGNVSCCNPDHIVATKGRMKI